MINLKIDFVQLHRQRRMRPEIAKLIEGIYPDLQNHPKGSFLYSPIIRVVSQYPNVKGIDKNLFFIDHDKPESNDGDSKSKYNVHEAMFCGQLCRYFLQQGYQPNQITILATYAGISTKFPSEEKKDKC